MITVVKKKKKGKGKKYIGSARFDPGTVTSYLKTLVQVNEDFLEMTKWKFFFIQNWSHHRRKHIQSDLTLEICSKKPVKRHMETPFEEQVSDRLHHHN